MLGSDLQSYAARESIAPQIREVLISQKARDAFSFKQHPRKLRSLHLRINGDGHQLRHFLLYTQSSSSAMGVKPRRRVFSVTQRGSMN